MFSPPHTPRYNGSIEAGIGSLKTRTERHATRAGHPSYWTCDDVAAAESEANATARPKSETGPTPSEVWDTRRRITAQERGLFQSAVQRQRDQLGPKEDLSSKEERRMQREAIRRALVEHGILLYSRRRIPLPITNQKNGKHYVGPTPSVGLESSAVAVAEIGCSRQAAQVDLLTYSI
jgi:hypothetical protein